MANEGAPAPQEIKLSRWWYEAHLRRVEPDYAEASEWVSKYYAGADEAFAIRDRLPPTATWNASRPSCKPGPSSLVQKVSMGRPG